MNLSPRLHRIADLVSKGVRIADIGTDHGYLPAFLLKSGKITFAIATDIHPRPLEKAIALLGQTGLKDRYDCRLGAGFQPLQVGECDEIIVAGMGGLMIRDMLTESEDIARSVKKMIFQPMNNSDVLRVFLSENHYEILHESIVRENDRFYEVMVVRDGEMPDLSMEEQAVGYRPVRVEDENFDAFVRENIEKTKAILETVSKKSTVNARKRGEECHALLEALQKTGRSNHGNKSK